MAVDDPKLFQTPATQEENNVTLEAHIRTRRLQTHLFNG
jgi:hypothetical protein